MVLREKSDNEKIKILMYTIIIEWMNYVKFM